MRHHVLLTITLCMGGTWACTGTGESTSPTATETLALQRDDDGNLRYCDSDDPEECVVVSNPNACEILQIDIETATGATCERCIDSEGQVSYERCEETAIDCTLVTAPEPDCVVCAHLDGPVIYSTCLPTEPEHCEYYPLEDGEGGVRECERCYDRRGNLISDSCGPNCSSVACPEVACAPGTRPVVPPGECCPVCIPEDRCVDEDGARVCPDANIPACPLGWAPVRDPSDCCSYRCEPRDCSAVDCPAVVEECPPGFHWERRSPHCCGMCVPDDGPVRCESDSDCGPDRFCSEPVICEANCYAGDSDSPSASEPVSCDQRCYGVCRPLECPGYAPPVWVDCEGEWTDPGFDANGCPRPPVCVCPDGTRAEDGRCVDRCEAVACPPSLPPNCGPDETWVAEYPYCCGACVPQDRALCAESGGRWGLGCGHTDCSIAVDCLDPTPSCDCGPRMSWVEGRGCVEDPACTGGNTCEYGGRTYGSGDSFPASDGCNTCSCYDGAVVCTEAACAECWGAWLDAEGSCRAPNDGVYPDSCCDEVGLCVETGGVWDETSCGHYTCGAPPACDAIFPGCDCGETGIFVPGQGCVESERCTQASACSVDGVSYPEGASWPKGDGCNFCTCLEGRVACTEAACAP